MKPSYWVIHLAVRGKVYVPKDSLPACLSPDGTFPKSDTFLWVTDHGGSPIGFPVSEIVSVEWIDDQVRVNDADFELTVNGEPEDDREPWQR